MHETHRKIYARGDYQGAPGVEIAIQDVMGYEGLTREEACEVYSDSDLAAWGEELAEADLDAELERLVRFFDGGDDEVGTSNPNRGLPIVVHRTMERDGIASSELSSYDSFDSPGDPVSLGCEIENLDIRGILDVNGDLVIEGDSPAGPVALTVRQMTEDGEAVCWPLSTLDDSPEESKVDSNSLGRMWEEDELVSPPRIAERLFGCPALEYEVDDVHVSARVLSQDERSPRADLRIVTSVARDGTDLGEGRFFKSLGRAREWCERRVASESRAQASTENPSLALERGRTSNREERWR